MAATASIPKVPGSGTENEPLPEPRSLADNWNENELWMLVTAPRMLPVVAGTLGVDALDWARAEIDGASNANVPTFEVA